MLGVFFILPIVFYGTGNALYTNSQNIAGLILMYANSLTIVITGFLMFRLMKGISGSLPKAYLWGRIAEALLLAMGIYNLNNGNERIYFLFYHLAMIALGIVSTLLFVRSKNILPHYLSLLGAIGYAFLLAGSVLELCGIEWSLPLSLPGGLFELFFGFVLLVCPRIIRLPSVSRS